ncbi:MAG: diguanylate cyclase [Clostridia bacterium]|nr:diguanylate cyclase [Clostridia bacterium]
MKKTLMIIMIIILIFPTVSYGTEDLFTEHGSIMLIIDPDTGIISFANKAAIEFYRYGETLIGMNISDINTLTSEEVNTEMAMAEHEMRNYFLFRHKIGDGTIKDVEVYSYPIIYKNHDMLFSIIFDVTEKISALNELEDVYNKQKSLLLRIVFVSIMIIFVISFLLLTLKKQNKSLHHIATYDALTGVYNRRSLRNIYDKLNHKSSMPLGVFMIDVNNLKFVNDVFGHIYGDEIIIAVARMLEQMDYEKYVSRVSGDEFVMIIPNCTSECSLKIESSIKNHLITIKGLHYNASVGSILVTEEMSFEDAFSKAESIMYNDKSFNKHNNNHRILNEMKLHLYRNQPGLQKREKILKDMIMFCSDYMPMPEDHLNLLKEAAIYQDIGNFVVNHDDLELHIEKSYYILSTLHPLKQLSTICYHHHECYDGSGYPKGLEGKDIPHTVRILIFVNTIYQGIEKFKTPVEVIKYLKEQSNHIIDPDLYNALDIDLFEDFLEKVMGKYYGKVNARSQENN